MCYNIRNYEDYKMVYNDTHKFVAIVNKNNDDKRHLQRTTRKNT